VRRAIRARRIRLIITHRNHRIPFQLNLQICEPESSPSQAPELRKKEGGVQGPTLGNFHRLRGPDLFP